MSKPIVYICGPITSGGGSIADNKARFFKAAELLESKNCVVLHTAGLPLGLTERDYMRISNAMLESASVLYVLPRSSRSSGALSEIAYATKLGLKVVRETSWLQPIMIPSEVDRDVFTEVFNDVFVNTVDSPSECNRPALRKFRVE